MTPNVAVVHISNPHWRELRLWLPLFLLWIPFVLLAPVVLFVILIVCLALQIHPWQAISTFWALTCSLPGTDVRVQSQSNRVSVRIL